MKELIFGITDKINTPYLYEDLEVSPDPDFNLDVTYKPTTLRVFLVPDDQATIDGDPESGLAFSYVSESTNVLPDNTPRSLDFGSNEDLEDTEYAHDFTFLILILSGVLNEAV